MLISNFNTRYVLNSHYFFVSKRQTIIQMIFPCFSTSRNIQTIFSWNEQLTKYSFIKRVDFKLVMKLMQNVMKAFKS
jgi:hypothetical protein